MSKRNVSESVKKQVAGRQRYSCATIEGYNCPMNNQPFDESGYDIDHIVELRHGGTNEISNLQALCVSCHRVKTTRNTTAPTQKLNCNEVLINGKILKLIVKSPYWP